MVKATGAPFSQFFKKEKYWMRSKTENIAGCFLGLAIGDALGVPVEFKSRATLKVDPVTEMIGYGVWDQPSGTWSDDSSLAFCLAESLLHGYDLNDIAQRSARWMQGGYWSAHGDVFDIGGTTRVALGRILEGEDARFSGETEERSNGNGSLMKIAPASLYFANQRDAELYTSIKAISSITHAHFRSVFGCFIFSIYIGELLKGAEKNIALKNTAVRARDFARKQAFNEREVALFIRILEGMIPSLREEEIYSGGYVIHTLEASIWCLLTTTSYKDAVLKAVNLGDDTDTTACVTGALAGLYYGYSSIPFQWCELVARKSDIIKLANSFQDCLQKKIFA
jgi:ADP-ribosyl-[dinitrogen reductase] hydrolase